MRSDNFVFTYDVGDSVGQSMLDHLRENTRQLNRVLKRDGSPYRYRVRLMARNPNRKHEGRHYKQTLPARYATRFDVYLYQRRV